MYLFMPVIPARVRKKNTQSKKDWRCGSSGRSPAFQGQSCKFKSQYFKKKKDRPKLEVGTVTPLHLAQPIPATQAPLRCLEYLPPRSALWIIKEFHETFNSLNSRDIYFSNVNSKF
jgi:hypothetical protein